MPAIQREIEPGKLLKDRYSIVRPLGSGGGGEIFLAQDKNLVDRPVVVKVIKVEAASQDPRDAKWVRRQFRDEIAALGRVDHPNVVDVIDAGETEGGQLYLVMQHVDGTDLRPQIGPKGMHLPRVAHIIRQVGRALSAAHEKGIVHCDLKPENIMLQHPGEAKEMVKLIDFGVAKVANSETLTSMIARDFAGRGTWQYMSPEQLSGGRFDELSDIYAMGVVAYEMVTGRRPFDVSNPVHLARMQERGIDVLPKSLRHELPDEAQGAILRALALNPRDRYLFAHDFGEKLANALEGGGAKRRGDEGRSSPPQGGQSGAHPLGHEAAAASPAGGASGARRGAAAARETADPELAHVLYLNLISAARATIDEQVTQRTRIEQIVRSTRSFKQAQQTGELIVRQTGSNLALVFSGRRPDAPMRCALEIADALRGQPGAVWRMGIHSGMILTVRDINDNQDVVGSGIYIAERVMDCGDVGHILVSKTVYDPLSGMRTNEAARWVSSLDDLGEHEVEPGEQVHLYNFHDGERGNPELPKRFRPTPPPPPPPETEEQTGKTLPKILTQILGVSTTTLGPKREGLLYRPSPVGDSGMSAEQVEITTKLLNARILAVQRAINDLIDRALRGEPRGDNRLDDESHALARCVLPEKGFAGLIAPGLHPQFDIYWKDVAAGIPWEAMEERYGRCPQCHKVAFDQAFCDKDGAQMERRVSKLALDYHLSHLVRGQSRPSGEGHRFLFIVDPTGDLRLPDARRDPHDRRGRHADEIFELVGQRGYQTALLAGANANRDNVLRALKDPELIGVYYFGHGYYDRDTGDCGLRLADEELSAGEIEKEAAPVARFVFLNACEAAAAGSSLDLDNRPSNVANAFAQGSLNRVVIAPMWPVIDVQAAEAATEFFKLLLAGASVGESLGEIRKRSFDRYQRGEAHLLWLVYRLLGDPNRSLAVQRVAVTTRILEAARAPETAKITIEDETRIEIEETEETVEEVTEPLFLNRVFDSDGQFNRELMSFTIDEVLLRAAKRRNMQGRQAVTITDFVAGLVRKGDLTRFALRAQGLKPDELYDRIGEYVETEIEQAGESEAEAKTLNLNPDNPGEEEIRELFSMWNVSARREFNPQLIEILQRADENAQWREARPDDRRVSEQDLLEALLGTGAWAPLQEIGLPAADEIKRSLARRGEFGIDENGWIPISPEVFDDRAQKLINDIHVLAQQRGVFPITNRLVLAALLTEESGFAARVCRQAGVDSELLCALVIATIVAETPQDPAPVATLSFGLSLEACERILLPVIETARRLTPEGQLVGEKELFRAFCEKADPGFKNMLKALLGDDGPETLEADLDELKEVDPGSDDLLKGLTPRARRSVRMAHAMAMQRGVRPISNRMMLAAFFANPHGCAARALTRRRLPAQELSEQLLNSTRGGAPQQFPLDQAACERVVKPMIDRARAFADENGFVTEQTLFKAFCEVIEPELKNNLNSAAIDLDALINEEPSPPSSGPLATPPPAPTAITAVVINRERFEEIVWRMLQEAEGLARLQGWEQIRTPHLFAAMIGDGSAQTAQALRDRQLDPEQVKQLALSVVPTRPPLVALPTSELRVPNFGDNAQEIINRALRMANQENRRVTELDLGIAFFADGGGVVGELLRQIEGAIPPGADGSAGVRPGLAARPALETFGEDLTAKAKQGLLPQIVGRDREIETAMETLTMMETANPLLVGEAGVGKTAIVEGLAQRIADGDCPVKLRSMRVIELSAGALVANTRLRGEFEQRVRDVLEEARENVILFIDEIHTIVGAGSAEGSGPDAGNMLKTALARGEIRLIGATTHAEYKRTIARDKALSRRFQAQMISPPSREATIQALSARQAALEEHHHVRISKAAKVAAVDLSGRYILDKQWPAKARDALERACALAATKRARRKTASGVTVTAAHVAEVVARQTGLPVERVSTSDLSALNTLEDRLNLRIKGQRHAVRAVADAIRRGRQGLADRNRPWGAFLFIGPAGVGKTELAKALAEEVFGGADGPEGQAGLAGLIRFDMGDFTEPHSAAKLVGAPPGYVGYDQGAPLVERLRTHPYSLLLFDEIEHGHENVLAVLLRLLAEGTLTDSDGNLADARNSIIIFTSNLLGAEQKLRRPGFASEPPAAQTPAAQTELRSLVERHLPAKLIDRLDGIIRFNPLTADDLAEIAEQKLSEVRSRVSALYGVSVEVAPEVLPWLAAKVVAEGSGARAVGRAVDDEIGNPLAAFLGFEQTASRGRVRVVVTEDAIQIEASEDGS